jgi:cellulose synthase/poly-beta-1,6-N-acetylglucosamine synthase-like glycosyltransferase
MSEDGAPLVAPDVLDRLRSELEVDPRLFAELDAYRASEAYRLVYEGPLPLVSILVCTYNRSRLLVERCVPSLLAQDYPSFEVVVVGDGCTDDTEAALARIGDPRLRFVNNVPRGSYPEHPILRWMVAGTVPANVALGMAKGPITTHIDDDDEFPPDRVTKLVALLRQSRAELVWHPFFLEAAPGQWMEWRAEAFEGGAVTTGSVLYLSWFNRILYDPTSYRYPEPADWNRYRKIKYLGAILTRHPEYLLRHYRERTQAGAPGSEK